ncbi:trypsin-like peptidase domain-containing protein [Hyphomonadaceae bacterium BL14]|nr:trypsin-like peptidase domain-containing protein [Hyphomonadaceae bacterium BL14]
MIIRLSIIPSLISSLLLAACATTGGPNYALNPTFGGRIISDEIATEERVGIIAGGEHNASLSVRSDCGGFIASAPDYRLDYQYRGGPLRIQVDSSGSTSLLINDPYGVWHCDDNKGNGPMPEVLFDLPPQGQYDIWVGSYNTNLFINADLVFIAGSNADRSQTGRPSDTQRAPINFDGGGNASDVAIVDARPSGTGFFISSDGYLVTSEHVIRGRSRIFGRVNNVLVEGRVVLTDAANDIALVKFNLSSQALSLSSSRSVRRGEDVFTLGYPLSSIQGSTQRAAFGRVNATSGLGDDHRFLQIDAPVHPGNSGGPVIGPSGDVIGIVTSRLNALAVLSATGSLPENVSYAIKSDYLIAMLPIEVQLSNISTSGDLSEMVSMASPSVIQIFTY